MGKSDKIGLSAMSKSPHTMVKSVVVHDFKCLSTVQVELEPLTVLIGKNDTGKTSFLEAIGCLALAKPPESLAQRANFVFGNNPNVLPDLIRHGTGPRSCAMKASMTDGGVREAVLSARGFAIRNQVPNHSHLENVQFPYRFDLDKLRAAAQVGALKKEPLPPDGEHLAAAVDRLPYKRFTQLQNELMARIPLIQELRPTTVESAPGMKEIWFDVKGAGPVPGRQMSDGVMLVLAILTVLYDENAPKLIMLEEPETGIHPKQLERLVEAFKGISAQGIQIILSTHSPYLLDFVPRECVRVFTRGADGEVVVKPLSDVEEIRDMMSRGFSLGEAWYNSDEDDIAGKSTNAHRGT